MKKTEKTTAKSAKPVRGKNGGKRPGAGRPKGKVSAARLELKEAAKKHGHKMLEVLVAIANNTAEKGAVRVAAANVVIDRGYGRPVQELRHGDPDGKALPMTIEVICAPPQEPSEPPEDAP